MKQSRDDVIFTRFGLPDSITADNGRQLISEEFQEFCKTNNIELVNTIPYWPQMNGEVERQNRSILKRLVISQNTKSDWRMDLNKYLLMYRSTIHSTMRKTPSEMLFGRNIRDKVPGIHQPMEADEETADNDREKKEKEKQYADTRRNAKPISLEKGDEVLVKRMQKTNKLASNFEPEVYKVVERKGGDVKIISEAGKVYRRHISHLQKIISGDPATASSSSNSDDAESSINEPLDTKDSTHSRRPTKRASDSVMEPRVTRSSKRPAHLNDFVI